MKHARSNPAEPSAPSQLRETAADSPEQAIPPGAATGVDGGESSGSLIAALLFRTARYPDAYCWYVLVCALDLMLTNTVIHHAGAIEANALAALFIERGGFWGLIAFKVATMLVVLLVCEALGELCTRQQRPKDTGKQLAEWAVAISAIPVVLTLAQLGVVAGANL